MILRLTLFIFLCAYNLVTGFLYSGEPNSQDKVSSERSIATAEVPADFEQLWAKFDPQADPLETEILHAWDEDGVTLRVVRFRIGRMKGSDLKLAGIYGFPTGVGKAGETLPGLLQIHGGGQYADYRACIANAKRGYATLSIAWAGRIHAPGYRVGPNEVKLFWDGRVEDPNYRETTDWGSLDAYHAPGRNARQQFPSIAPGSWKLDPVDSPRNSGWYLCALAARRGLTFLERQTEVDADRLGVYGHSMGGKLTVMVAVDSRVRVAAPSCGGISDRDNASQLFRQTLGDNISLPHVSCPTIFLSPSNDFHGRIGDLPDAVQELNCEQWRLVCSPHHNHQDTASYEVATMLWMDQHLRNRFQFPATPQTHVSLDGEDGVPEVEIIADSSLPIASVDVYYTLDGKADETPRDRLETMTRYWRHAAPEKINDTWKAKLLLQRTDAPLWVYANVRYALPEPVSGVGYYYGAYTANALTLSSMLSKYSAQDLREADVQPTRLPVRIIEDFGPSWEKEWFTLRPPQWARTTFKIHDPQYQGSADAKLALVLRSTRPNVLILKLDDYVAAKVLSGSAQWQRLAFGLEDFKDPNGTTLEAWSAVRGLSIMPIDRLEASRREGLSIAENIRNWQGDPPEFRLLEWEFSNDPDER